MRVQPQLEVTLCRPWHCGVAALGDPQAEVPASLQGQAVSVGEGVIAIGVRHAQDIEADRSEGDWDWATAVIQIRSLVTPSPLSGMCSAMSSSLRRTGASLSVMRTGWWSCLPPASAPGFSYRLTSSTPRAWTMSGSTS